MPCRTDGYRDSTTREQRLHRTLLGLRGEPIPDELIKWTRNYDGVGALCDKIRECGGLDYLEKLKEDSPGCRLEVAEIITWWKRHEIDDELRDLEMRVLEKDMHRMEFQQRRDGNLSMAEKLRIVREHILANIDKEK